MKILMRFVPGVNIFRGDLRLGLGGNGRPFPKVRQFVQISNLIVDLYKIAILTPGDCK